MELREEQSSGIVGRPLPATEIYEELDQANPESEHANRAYQRLLYDRRDANANLQMQPQRRLNSPAMSAAGNCGGKASDVPSPDRDYLIPKSSDEELGRRNSYSEPTNPGGHQCLLDSREPSTTLQAQPRRNVDSSASGNCAKKGSHCASSKYEQHIVSFEPFDGENIESDSYHALQAIDVASPERSADPSKQNTAPSDDENQEDETYNRLEAINASLPEPPPDKESQNNNLYHVLESSV